MRLLAVFGLGLFALLGCAGDGDPAGGGSGELSTGDSDAGGSINCTDGDDDGFGRGCRGGPDCDDGDPEITDECRRCAMDLTGCECEPGTKPMSCDPKDQHITQNGVTGTLVCSEGARYCREGAWSDCEILWQYATFVPD